MSNRVADTTWSDLALIVFFLWLISVIARFIS